MKTKQQVIEILTTIMPQIEREYGVRKLGLFGSYARDEQGAESDIDLMVEVDPSIGLRFAALAERLEDELEQPVEVVSSRALRQAAVEVISKDLIYV